MSWREVNSTQRVKGDAENASTGIRVYRVWNYARTAILNKPENILDDTGRGLPPYNSVWEGMALDSYEASPVGNIFEVTGQYSTDGRFKNGRLNPLLPTYASWAGTFQRETVDIPFARWATTRLTFANINPNQPPTTHNVNGWVFDKQPILHTFQRHEMRVVLNRAQVDQAQTAMYAQVGKLHRIYGRWYQFEAADYAEQEKGKWEVRYSWVYDPGTPKISADTGPQPPPSNVPAFPLRVFEWPAESNQLWVRPPFHQLIISPNRTGIPTDLPEFTPFMPFDDSDPLGWGSLPRFLP